jgi:hypothetical protein
MRSFILVIVLFTKYCLGDQIKEYEIDRACSMHERGLKHIQAFNKKTWKEETWA